MSGHQFNFFINVHVTLIELSEQKITYAPNGMDLLEFLHFCGINYAYFLGFLRLVTGICSQPCTHSIIAEHNLARTINIWPASFHNN